MGSRHLALVGAALLLACGAVGCVDSTDSSDEPETVGAAQSSLGTDEAGNAVYEGAEETVPSPDVAEDDPEPSPWVPGILPQPQESAPGDSGDPSLDDGMDPEPSPWTPAGPHDAPAKVQSK